MADAALRQALARLLRESAPRVEALAGASGATALQDADRLAQRLSAIADVLDVSARGADAEELLRAARIEDVRRPVAAALGIALDDSDGEDLELF